MPGTRDNVNYDQLIYLTLYISTYRSCVYGVKAQLCQQLRVPAQVQKPRKEAHNLEACCREARRRMRVRSWCEAGSLEVSQQELQQMSRVLRLMPLRWA